MIKNFIKIALRNLFRHPVFSAINISGLALGMAAALAIAYYVAFELSYDDFHRYADQTYRVILERNTDKGSQEAIMLPPVTAHTLLETAGVEQSLRFINVDYQNNSLVVSQNNETRTVQVENMYYADSTVSNMLDIEWAEGEGKYFNVPGKVLLSTSVANNLFGSQPALGRVVSVSGNIGTNDYEVAGVFHDMPEQSDFDFNVLLSISSVTAYEGEQVLTSLDYWGSAMYVRLAENTMPETVALEFTDRMFANTGEVVWNTKLVPLREMHFMPFAFKAAGDRQYVLALALIGVIILILAWVNYINLATSRALDRSREVGVRKVMGSKRRQLVIQFMAESLVLNLLAATLAFTTIQLVLPYLREIANPMQVSEAQRPVFWLVIPLIIVTGALLSGCYPAFVLSSFKPASIFSGRFRTAVSGVFIRKGLVIFQFAISIFLMIGTLVVYQQINFMRSKELGLNIDNRLIINSPPGVISTDNSDFFDAVDAFRTEVGAYAFVGAVSGASSVPGESINWGDNNITKLNDDSEENPGVALIAADTSYFDVYEIGLLAGRGYRRGDNTFSRGDIVINDRARQQFGFATAEEAVGEKLTGGNLFPELTIIGVTENYHHTSLHNDFSPILYVLSSWANYYAVSLTISENMPPADKAELIREYVSEVEQAWYKHFPEAPFDYFFADQVFDSQYKEDRQFGLLFGGFTLLAIVIALLGLVGLVSYEVVQRTKELGIRRVLGARIPNLVHLLAGKYLIMVGIAGLAGLPAGYMLLDKWLDSFAFRIEINILLLLLPFITVTVIALFSITVQVFLASRKDPVHSIRYE